MNTRLKSVNYYHSSTNLLFVLQTSTDVAAVVVYYCRWWVRSYNEYVQHSNTCSCILVISRILMLHEYFSLRNLKDIIHKKIFTAPFFQNKPFTSISAWKLWRLQFGAYVSTFHTHLVREFSDIKVQSEEPDVNSKCWDIPEL